MSCYVDDGQPIPLGAERQLIFERVVGNRSVIIENVGFGALRIGSEKVEQTNGFGLPSGGRLSITVPDIPDKLYAIAEDPEEEPDELGPRNAVLVTSIIEAAPSVVEVVEVEAID